MQGKDEEHNAGMIVENPMPNKTNTLRQLYAKTRRQW